MSHAPDTTQPVAVAAKEPVPTDSPAEAVPAASSARPVPAASSARHVPAASSARSAPAASEATAAAPQEPTTEPATEPQEPRLPGVLDEPGEFLPLARARERAPGRAAPH